MPKTIPAKLIEDTARELTARAAIDIPADYREGVRLARDRESNRLGRFVLGERFGELGDRVGGSAADVRGYGAAAVLREAGERGGGGGGTGGAGAGAAAGDRGGHARGPAAGRTG